MLRRILITCVLLSFVLIGSGCFDDQEIIEKHQQTLEEDE